jgi:hypothetical protein
MAGLRSFKDADAQVSPQTCDHGSGGDAAVRRPARLRGAARNVGGGRHDCHMSSPRVIGADARPALGPWLLAEAPLVDVNFQADLP